MGGDGPAGAPPPNVQPAGAAAGGVGDIICGVANMYHGLDPQLKILCGVVLLYVVIQVFF